MPSKLLKRFVPLLCVGAMAAAPAAAGAVTVGISDNTTTMFFSPYFKALHLTQARLLIPWNTAVLKNKSLLRYAHTWVKDAQSEGIHPLVDFSADGGRAGNYIPSVRVYAAAVKAFIRDFPTVKQYIPWNEPDWNFRPGLARHPALAAAYFNVLHQLCPPKKGCTVAAGDLYLAANQLGRWIKAYKKGLRYRPAAWALHPYNDIQGHQTAQIQTMLRLTSGQIWLTEISGVIRRGHWHGHTLTQSPKKQAQDEAFLFSLPRRFHRITRIYHYQWQGEANTKNTGWDSGLIAPNGAPRPAYYVVLKAATGK